jgi:hypothetical protein
VPFRPWLLSILAWFYAKLTELAQAGGRDDRLLLQRLELSARRLGLIISVIGIVAGVISLIIVGGVVVLALLAKPIHEQAG